MENKVVFEEGLTIKFQKLTLEDKPLFDRFFRERRYENAHYNFTNLFMWRKAYNIQWTLEGDYLCVKACWEGEVFFLPPFGPEQGLAGILDIMLEHAKEHDFPFALQGVEGFMVKWIESAKPGYFKAKPERDNYDYVYLAKDLIELKGRKFHTKKNHVNSFRKKYSNYQYVPMTEEMTKQCIDFMQEWCDERGCVKGDDLDCERNAIVEAMNNFIVLDFQGGAIFVDDKMVAFSYGEMSNEDTAVIHVEKGRKEFNGVYGVINQEFCAHNFTEAIYINREEDMGIEGLRKAKESYHPIKMVEKYSVRLNS